MKLDHSPHTQTHTQTHIHTQLTQEKRKNKKQNNLDIDQSSLVQICWS